MRMFLARSIGFLAFVLLSISNDHSGHSQGVNTTAEPQYLMPNPTAVAVPFCRVSCGR
jgi:hypothetical protein